MDVSAIATLQNFRCTSSAQADLTIVNTQPLIEVLAGGNVFDSGYVDSILVALDGNGLLNGTVNTSGQTPLAPPSAATGQVAYASLVGKGWTVITDPWEYIFDDGTGTFWLLVVDALGNVGTTTSLGPATAAVVLADGGGGFWQVAVDTDGNRYTISHAGPATAAPVIEDPAGIFWQLIVDTDGNLGATSLP